MAFHFSGSFITSGFASTNPETRSDAPEAVATQRRRRQEQRQRRPTTKRVGRYNRNSNGKDKAPSFPTENVGTAKTAESWPLRKQLQHQEPARRPSTALRASRRYESNGDGEIIRSGR
jgi:hypothetical protein